MKRPLTSWASVPPADAVNALATLTLSTDGKAATSYRMRPAATGVAMDQARPKLAASVSVKARVAAPAAGSKVRLALAVSALPAPPFADASKRSSGNEVAGLVASSRIRICPARTPAAAREAAANRSVKISVYPFT